MKNFFLSAAIICLFIGTSCKSNTYKAKDKTPDEVMKHFSETGTINVGKQNYDVDVPTGWATKDTFMNGIQFHFLTAPIPDGNFNTNMNVLNESMQNLSFEDYKKKTQETIKNYMPSFSIVESGDIAANGIKGSWFRYTMQQSGIKTDIINYTFPKDGIAYIITGAAKAGTMDKYRSTFDAVAKSFKLKN